MKHLRFEDVREAKTFFQRTMCDNETHIIIINNNRSGDDDRDIDIDVDGDGNGNGDG